MTWSAKQYLAFEDERTRPVRDLLNALPDRTIRRAIDIGCGPGNSTEVLAARFPAARVEGLDSSPEMLDAARKRLPQIDFKLAAIETWREPSTYDLIFANAVLQWVPDHATLLPRLLQSLAPQGVLAMQIPDNLDEPAHQLMRDIAAEPPFADKLAAASQSRVKRESAEFYYSLLRPHCAALDLWRTTYYHQLSGGTDAVIEWFKGTGLRPFLTPLSDSEQKIYLDRYRAALARAYPPREDGSVLLPFPRLFIIATR
ncbi:MAG TPA: trans-aconitate 2-methyltransferase [Beijerinckiaceae bacterium]|nr:trans-aconitate 2-methyltransferase [Beijerinckiaceae bacterium]